MNENIVKGYSYLSQAAAENNIPPGDARTWLVNALDPFHDLTTEKVGIPDLENRRSCTMELTQIHNVQSVQDYDFMVNIIDFMPGNGQGFGFTDGTLNSTLKRYQGSATGMNLSSGNILMKPSTDTNPYFAPAPSRAFLIQHGTDLSRIMGMQYRVVSAGFEVVCTSSPLMSNGSVVLARRKRSVMANESPNLCFEDGQTGNFTEWRDAKVVTLPYATAEQASQDPNHRLYPASEGCYCVAVIDVEKPQIYAHYKDDTMVLAAKYPDSVNSNIYVLGPPAGSATEANRVNGSRMGIKEPPAAYFIGCSSTTTFTVTFRFVFEVFPDDGQALWLIARPSPHYSPEAIVAYLRATQNLPAGVMIKENPFGEWFETVMGILSMAATPLGTALGFAPIGVAASATFAMAGRLNRYYRELEENRKRPRIGQ